MPNLQLLNPKTHGQLRLRPAAEAAPHFVQVLAPEFQVAATCCPILFTKDPETGSFYAGAMFGFKPGENLLGSAEDRGGFHPLMLQREGFFMSERTHRHRSRPCALQRARRRAAVRRSPTAGELAARDPTHAGRDPSGLERNEVIHRRPRGAQADRADRHLAGFANGERLTLQGLYTVSLDRLRDVDDAAALALFRAGHLQLAYTMAGRSNRSRDSRGCASSVCYSPPNDCEIRRAACSSRRRVCSTVVGRELSSACR